ncbi:hypothetical protein AB0G04_23860 [Actinoplanes sp. NPDC023801]|uniref:hypothetical protein n=1 Tax=Actinoplanes sp. NPDC023801 TaxID=3154595 RepID=UPI0033F72533
MGGRTMSGGGAGVLLVAMLAAGGCAAGDAGNGNGAVKPGATVVSAPTSAAVERADAAVALAASLEALKKDSYRFTTTMGGQGSMTGVVDPSSRNSEFVLTSTTPGKEATTIVRVVDGAAYVKIEMANGKGGPGLDGRKWRKVAASGPMGPLADFDPAQTTKGLEMAADVQWVDADTVTGTIDLTKLAQSMGQNPGAPDDPALRSMPFEASFDGTGRLVDYRFTPKGDAAKVAAKSAVKFTDFGVAPVDVKAPPAADILRS